MERGMVRAGAGGVKAALWLVTTMLGRTPATRGQFPRHTVAWLYAGRPLNPSIQFVQTRNVMPDSVF